MNGYSIAITIHAVPADDADAAVDVARAILIANVTDAHEYAYDSTDYDDDFHDEHRDEPERFSVTFSRDF